MLSSHQHLRDLSDRYQIPQEDIFLIALNACGLRSPDIKSRMRFYLRLARRPEEQFYFILPFRQDSPFEFAQDRILFQGEQIAEVETAENDDAVLSYFRNDRKVLTLNSNARSQCVGCAFCYTVLQDESDPRLRLMDDLHAYLTLIKDTMGWHSLAPLNTLAVCTGCFHYENLAIDHLKIIKDILKASSSEANLHFLSSVLRTPSAFKRVQQELAPFHLTLTIECLTQRQLVLKKSKASLTLDKMVEVLRLAREHDIKVDFTYIVGLDPLDVITDQLPILAAEVTTFPRFQVFQAHNTFMDTFASPKARNLEYFLMARKLIEKMFLDRGLRPRSWENYRPLWYFSFADEELTGTRI
jgi:hypothetical protein